MKIHDAHVTSARFVRNCPDLSHSLRLPIWSLSSLSSLCVAALSHSLAYTRTASLPRQTNSPNRARPHPHTPDPTALADPTTAYTSRGGDRPE